VFDVSEVEPHDLSATHRGGVAEQDDRGVADPDRRGAVDPGNDLSDLVDGERASQSAGRRAVGAHEPAAYLPDSLGGDRVLGAGHAVHVSDGGTGHVEGAGRLASLGAFGQYAHRASGPPGKVGIPRDLHQRSPWAQTRA
jgi:hypothetical protein